MKRDVGYRFIKFWMYALIHYELVKNGPVKSGDSLGIERIKAVCVRVLEEAFVRGFIDKETIDDLLCTYPNP